MPRGSDLGVQLPQTSGGGITRIDKQLVSLDPVALVERLEGRLGHEYFTAHFQQRRIIIAPEFQRHRPNGTNVFGNIFTDRAIAPGGGTLQHAIAIEDTDRQTIELGLAAIAELADSVSHPLMEGSKVFFTEGVVQTEHRFKVSHLFKLGQRQTTDSEAWRVAALQFRVLGLQHLEPLHQAVIFGVGNAGVVIHIVANVVLVNGTYQLINFVFNGLHKNSAQNKGRRGGLG